MIRVVAYGRVQGVGFRQWALERAVDLGLSGFVRNLPDGRSLEVQADGDQTSLDELVRLLHEGPSRSRVERVEVISSDGTTGVRGFIIRA